MFQLSGFYCNLIERSGMVFYLCHSEVALYIAMGT